MSCVCALQSTNLPREKLIFPKVISKLSCNNSGFYLGSNDVEWLNFVIEMFLYIIIIL